MTNYSRTTLRELKKRYLNVLKKCLLANLGIILLSTPSMAEPTTYTAEEIYEKLTNGETVGISGQIIDEPIQAGVFTGRLNIINGSNITFEDGSVFKGNVISLSNGQTNTEASTLNFGETIFDGAAIVSYGKISFNGDMLFKNSKHRLCIVVFGANFKNVEFYDNSRSGRGVLYIENTYESVNTIAGNSYFGKYILDENGNYTFNEDGSLKTLGNKAISTAGAEGGAIFLHVATLEFKGKSEFIGNEVNGGTRAKGGAIWAQNVHGIPRFYSSVDFELNKAISSTEDARGGALFVGSNGSAEFNQETTFGGYLMDANGNYILDKDGQKISIGNMAISKETLDAEGNVVASGNAYGGALYVENGGNAISFSPTHQTSFIANSAISESAEAYGGAIADIAIGRSIKFQNNSLFQDNIAQGATKAYGGAIYNESGTKNNDGTIKTAGVTLSDVSFIGNKAESTTTDGEAKGGAIYNSGTMKFNGEALFENNIAKHGGAIYNEGTIEFNGKTEFIGNESRSGGAINNNWGGKITFKDSVKFEGNETGNGDGGSIHNWSIMIFEKDVSFINNKGGVGGAMHNRANAKFLGHTIFSGNSGVWGSGYHAEGSSTTEFNTARFENNIGGGALDVIGQVTFNGKAEFINNKTWGVRMASDIGTLTFKDGADFRGNISGDKFIDVYFTGEKGTINFGAVPEDLNQLSQTETGAEIVEGGFASANEKGVVNKYSNSTLTFLDSADNTGFKGTFNQYIGKTIAHSEKFLAGTNNILGGVLETHGAKIGYTANIGDETHTASLIHHSTATGTSAPTSLTTALKIGASSTALFDSVTNGIQANYVLTEDMAGAGTVTFKDAHLTLGQTNYNGAYIMGENVTLNMQDGDTADSVSFANLTGSANLKIDADIVNGANGLELVTDQIETSQEATLKLALTDVVLSESALDNGLSESYTATVMTGGTLTYGSEKGLVATDVYSYEVSGANNQITIDAVKFNEGSDVMKSVAEFDGDAAFNMTIGGDSYEMQSDVVMTKNTKSIVGKDKETSTLTGKKITVNGATLNVENVSVSGENQLIDVASGTLNVTNAKVEHIENAGKTTLNTAEVSELENSGTLTANDSTIGELLNGNKAEVTGGKVTKVTNNGELTVTGATITELLNEQEATITGGELETVTNKEKGMLSLSAVLRAGTVTNEGELTLDGVTVADLTNSASLKMNGATVQKLVNEHEAELTASTVEDLTNTGKMTAKDLTLKGALKGTGTATLSGKLVADDIFKSENKIISDGMEVSENVKKMELADLEIKEGTTLDIGTREVTAKEVSVGDKATLQVTLNNLDEHGTMKADKIDAGAGAGVHLVLGEKFEGGVFDVFQGTKGARDLEVKHNNLYNVIEVSEGKYSFMTKDTEALQESLGATKEEVSVADAMTKGTASHKMFARMQSEMLIALQSLETDTVAKAKKALSAVGAKEQPIEQSVASEHLVALQNVVQAELHETTVGRAGGDTDPRAKVYIKGLYDRTKSSMGEGFRARSKGAVLGVQSEVTEDLTLGVGYATSQTTAKEDLRRTEVDTNTGFISAHYQPNAWWVSGLATFSRGEYEEEKQILSSMGKASYNVDSWGAQVMTGYDIRLENAIITPEVGLRYLSVKQEGYTDTLGTTVSGTRSDYLTALAGVKGTWDMGPIRPIAGVTVGYDIISDDVSALNTLANGASYTVNGEALDRLSTTVTTGIEADLGERTTLKLEYSGTYRKEYLDHSGMLRLEWRF